MQGFAGQYWDHPTPRWYEGREYDTDYDHYPPESLRNYESEVTRLPQKHHTYDYVARNVMKLERPRQLNANLRIPYTLDFQLFCRRNPYRFNDNAAIAESSCKSCKKLNEERPRGAQELFCVVSPDYKRCSLCICLNLTASQCGLVMAKSRSNNRDTEKISRIRPNEDDEIETGQEQETLKPLRKRARSKSPSPLPKEKDSPTKEETENHSPQQEDLIMNTCRSERSTVETSGIPSEPIFDVFSRSSVKEESMTPTKEIEMKGDTFEEETKDSVQNEMIADLYKTNFYQKQEIKQLKKENEILKSDQNQQKQEFDQLREQFLQIQGFHDQMRDQSIVSLEKKEQEKREALKVKDEEFEEKMKEKDKKVKLLQEHIEKKTEEMLNTLDGCVPKLENESSVCH